MYIFNDGLSDAVLDTNIQGRLLADWTDCFQSGPPRKGARRYAYELTQTYTFNQSCLCGACAGPTYFLNEGPVSNENKCELRGFRRPQYFAL